MKPVRIRQSAYLNNLIEQDHRRIKRRVRPMLGFQTFSTARVILSGIEMIHMMRKQEAKYACSRRPSLAEQFDRYCQVDALWTKLAWAEPPSRFKLLHEGSTGRIVPSGEGVFTRNPVLIGRQTMTVELEVAVDQAVG